MTVVLGKLAISLLLSLITTALLFWKEKLNDFIANNSQFAILGSWVLLRLLPFALVYWVLGYTVKSDVVFFYNTAKQALDGLIVYRDFWQPYSPLFPYFNALALAIIDAPESIIFLMMIYELLAVYVTRPLVNYRYSAFYIILYFSLPAPLIFLIFGGQEDIFLWLFIALALWCYKKYNNALYAGIVLGIGIACTKILLIIPVILLLIFSKARLKLISGLLIIGIPAIAIMFYLAGVKILAPLQLGDLPFAPNLMSILSPFIGGFKPDNTLLNWGGLVIIIAVAAYCLRNLKPYSESKLLIFAFILTNMITIIVHKNSLPNYLYTFLLPVIYFFGETFKPRQWALMILLNITGAVQPSFWYCLGGAYYNSFGSLSLMNWVEYCLQIVYLGVCIYFAYFINRISGGEVKALLPQD
ncbi:hypothetical protein [Emticicia fluvialis]|uniref:hypothetical protein n=1 Tax=Emticicia fluvialis TaxID=2974474 RepID=UPI0021656B75|nr:hypothetical protein [Emticicia fluvialis]